MLDNEQLEYQGLAAAVGRLTMALKRTEDTLAAVTAERDSLAERLATTEGGTVSACGGTEEVDSPDDSSRS